MLTLTRRIDERIIVTVPPSAEPTRVIMTVVDVDRNKVRLGWAAPRDVEIHREEIQERRDREQGAT